MSANPPGETREKEREDRQGGGGSTSLLSGRDERSEPESHSEKLPAVNQASEHTERAADAPARSAGASAALPCQRSNNCIEEDEDEIESASNQLSPYRRKCRHRLIMAIEWMVKKYGINYVGLLTLTFGVPGSGRGSQASKELREQAKDLEFVQKRWHSLNTNIIIMRYADWICILEPQGDGVWHLHVVVATLVDIRTETDVETTVPTVGDVKSRSFCFCGGKNSAGESCAKILGKLRKMAKTQNVIVYGSKCKKYTNTSKYMKLIMEHPHTGIIKNAPIGGSGIPFFRGDIKWSIIVILLFGFLNIIGAIIWLFINYNKIYIKELLEKGFKVKDVYGGSLEDAKKKLGINLPTFETQN